MASKLDWMPDSLYNSAVSAVVVDYRKHKDDIRALPESVMFDVYQRLFQYGRLCELSQEFTDLDTFSKLLQISSKRSVLHYSFQALIDHGVKLPKCLADSFCRKATFCETPSRLNTIKLGLCLGGFFNEAGCYDDSERILLSTFKLCETHTDVQSLSMSLECCTRILRARNAYCKFTEAESSISAVLNLVEILKKQMPDLNTAKHHAEIGALYLHKIEFKEAYKWCSLAMLELNESLPPKVIIDILRVSGKSLLVMKEFKQSELLLQQAVCIAREEFGSKHAKYADSLLDYAYYLLTVDCVAQSVTLYQEGLDIRTAVFGGSNLHVAHAHEDLAYASYVHEYSTGKFDNAQYHAERTMKILDELVPGDHFLLAGSKRVLALILEEQAIDKTHKPTHDALLREALDLHLAALSVTKRVFGEENVQTAKHYGNLGRLCQSMQKYKKAERLHHKAIKIKESILGPDEYEVALSIGHLASLYNYDMKKYSEAEFLYMRSIDIGKRLFGGGYSGLEYDYKGLIRVYSLTDQYEKEHEYRGILHNWHLERREQMSRHRDCLQAIKQPALSVAEIVTKYKALAEESELKKAPATPEGSTLTDGTWAAAMASNSSSDEEFIDEQEGDISESEDEYGDGQDN